jgi:hypothetical protein
MPDLEPHLELRATADQVRALDRLIRCRLIPALKILGVALAIDVCCQAWSIYDRVLVIHPEQDRSARERSENKVLIDAARAKVDEEHVRINRLFDREERVEKAVFSR